MNDVLCANCGLGRRDPMPSESELEAYYHSGYRIEIGKGRKPAKGRLLRIAKLAGHRAEDLACRIPSSARILDIGCGAGEFVYLLNSLGFEANGFDPDSNYMEWARSVIGPIVQRARIEEAPVAPSSCDVITMYHVLEHMRDPGWVLRTCASWLRENGLLLIEVPNFESVVQAPGHQYHKPHIYHFNQHTLSAFAARAGLKLEEGGVHDYGENLRCYFRKIASVPAENPADAPNALRVLNVLQNHKRSEHYLSVHPYRRLWNKVSRTISETIQTRGRTHEQILKDHATALKQRIKTATRDGDRTLALG